MRTTNTQRRFNIGSGNIKAGSLGSLRGAGSAGFTAKVGGTHKCQFLFGTDNAVCKKCGKTVPKIEILLNNS
jgi:hypothetical protein